MIKTNEENSQYLENPRRELYESRDNIDVYRNVFLEISEDLSSNWIKYDFKRTYYYDFKKKVIISNRDRINNDIKLDSFRLFTFNVNQYSRNKVISKYKQMAKENNYENLDFSWDELYKEIHSIFRKKIEKLNLIVIPEVLGNTDTLYLRLIEGQYCYTEVDSDVIINALLYITYGRERNFLNSASKIKEFDTLISKYNITIQDVNYFFEKNAKLQYSLGNLLFICKFVSKGTVLEVIKILLLRGNSKSELINRITKHRDGYVNDEDIQFFVDYIQNLPDN